MKNMMRRTVAFMLMACLLLSVMAPTAFAATDVEYAGEVYDASMPAGFTKTSYAIEDTVGDFTVVDKYGTFKAYATYAQLSNYGKPASVATFVALGFNVKEAGLYDVSFYVGNVESDIFIMPLADYSKYKTENTKDDTTLTINSSEYVGTIGDASGYILSYNFTTAGDYVVVFNQNTTLAADKKGSESSHYNIIDITLIPTTKLTGNVEQNITLKDGAVLDLNGYTVTGNVYVVNGQVIDSGAVGGGAGGVKGTLEASNNKWLPLKDSTGTYRFFEYTTKKNVVEGDAEDKYWFDADFTNSAAYALLNTNGTLSISLECSNAETIYPVVFVGIDGVVAGWAAAAGASNQDYAMYVSVTNIPADVTYIKVTPVFTTNNGSGATISFGLVSHSYAA